MQIQVNTDNRIKGTVELTRRVEEHLTTALQRFQDRITRVEVHFADESNSARYSPNDKRCVLEARPSGRQPVTASHDATTLDDALEGASAKLATLLRRTFERLADPRAGLPERDPTV
jgi:ribosome-associated translation inhibitor RaiA